MKNIILTFSILAASINMLSQSTVIDKYNTEENEDIGDLQVIDGYIYIPYAEYSSIEPAITSKKTILKFDQELNLVDSITFNIDTTVTSLNIRKGVGNMLYLIQWTRGGANGILPRIKLIKLDANLNIIINKEYDIPVDYIASAISRFSLNDNFIIIQGRPNHLTDGFQRSWVWKFNENCDTVFTKVISIDDPVVTNIVKIPNSSDYLYTSAFSDGMVRADSILNFKKRFIDIILWNSYSSILFDNSNNAYIFFSDIYVFDPEYSNLYKVYILKTDTSFSSLDTGFISFGDEFTNKYLMNTEPSFHSTDYGIFVGSRTYISSSTSYFSSDTNYLSISNYSMDLDLIWNIDYYQHDSTLFGHSLIEVSDGLILAGTKYCPFDEDINLDAFLVKFDFNGNLITTHNIQRNFSRATVYPNPGYDSFKLRSLVDIRGGILRIYDQNGKLLINKKVESEDQEIDTKALIPGSYIWTLQYDKNIVAKGVWIKGK